MLAIRAPGRVTLFGRHENKMALVSGLAARRLVDESTASSHAGEFDLVVEATGARGWGCEVLRRAAGCWGGLLWLLADESTGSSHAGEFDLVAEATGAPGWGCEVLRRAAGC